jgi:2-hydroxychromene-2-carboxylate isomerase
MDGERLSVRLYYDFASTLCYVAHRVLERMAPDLEALELELEWAPLDLALLVGWRRGGTIEPVRIANAERVARELGVPVRVPPAWPDSRPALAAAFALRGSPREATWRERVWTAIYDEGRALDEAGELERLAGDLELELEPRALQRGLGALELATHVAAEEQVTGVPTFMLGEWPFGGIQEEETLRSVLGRYARRRREGLC